MDWFLYNRDRRHERIKKENLNNDLINLTETNHQMTSDHSVSTNNTLKSHLNAKSSKTVAVVRSTVFCFIFCCKGDVNV